MCSSYRNVYYLEHLGYNVQRSMQADAMSMGNDKKESNPDCPIMIQNRPCQKVSCKQSELVSIKRCLFFRPSALFYGGTF